MNVFQNLMISRPYKEEKITINEKLLEIYKKRACQRTNTDNEILYNIFEELPFFLNLLDSNSNGDLMLKTIVQRIEFRVLKSGDYVYKYKDLISSMCFVIEGKFIVYKPPKKYGFRKSGIYNPNRLKFIDKIVYAFKNYLSAQINKTPDYYVNKGNQYGMQDIKKQKREVLSEVTTNICVIGEISLNEYSLIFEKTEILEKTDVLGLLSSLKIFEKMNNDFLLLFYDKIKKKRYKKKDFVCKRGEKFENIFIIRNGSFQLFFNSNVKFMNEYDLNSFENRKIISSGNTAKILNFEINDVYKENFEYKLLNNGTGEIIGDIEYINKLSTYLFNLQSIVDNSQILVIPIDEFAGIVNKKFMNNFIRETQPKISFYQNRINELKKVNRKLERNQNPFKSIILNKIKINKGKMIEKLEKIDKIKSQTNNVKVKKLYIKKVIHLKTEPNYKISTSLPSTEYSNKSRLKSASPYSKIMKINEFKSPDSYKEKKKFNSPKFKLTYTVYKNINKPSSFKSKFIQTPFDHDNNKLKAKLEEFKKINKNIKSRNVKNTLIYANHKKFYSQCFEVNKDFFLHNNTSILRKDLNDIFMKLKD